MPQLKLSQAGRKREDPIYHNQDLVKPNKYFFKKLLVFQLNLKNIMEKIYIFHSIHYTLFYIIMCSYITYIICILYNIVTAVQQAEINTRL